MQSRDVRKYGNEVYLELVGPVTGQTVVVAYWDFWLAIVLVRDFAGDWNRLVERLRRDLTDLSFRHYAAEGLLNHLSHLQQSWQESGLTAHDVLAAADPAFVKSQTAKARRQILEDMPPDQEKSYWMLHTPRAERELRARRGYWDRFPVSPARYAEELKRLYKTSGFYGERESWSLGRKLSSYIRRSALNASQDELLALYRAFLTVVLEKMNMVDDSYGVIGMLTGDIFIRYIEFDRSTLAMRLTDFFQDLIEWLVWEDYGFTYEIKPAFFSGLAPSEVPLVDEMLQLQWHELGNLELTYQAERALTMLGMLCTQQGLFDRFVDLARAMGTREWQRITTMSEMAEKDGQYDLARAVYEAAMSPGRHEGFLRKKYAELLDRLAAISKSSSAER